MIAQEIVDLSRFQFAATVMYHYIFVPLTLGLSFMLALMETIYVVTGKTIYRDMTKFWGKLFAINFALGITTGITMEFQFGTNWSYYSHYVGDIFGAPLAIEGLMAFFLESTFVGLFFFGWDRFSKKQHLLITYLVAFGSNFSALWILIANAWMQNPIGSEFNYETMRMELTSFSEVIFNEVAQVKFAHTVFAAYSTAAMFVLGISSYYLLKKRDIPFAKRSFAIAAVFGFIAIIATAVLGDESAVDFAKTQPMKLAAIESKWETEEAPASFNVIALPNQEKQENTFALKIPYLLGLMATRSTDTKILGIKDLVAINKQRIIRGKEAYALLLELRAGNKTQEITKQFESLKDDLGYGLLLKKYREDIHNATDAQIEKASLDTVPNVLPLFLSLRIMVGLGFLMIGIFGFALLQTLRKKIDNNKLFLKAALFSIPIPWIATEAGWLVAEYGRQPFAITDILPTALSVSNVSLANIWTSLIMFIVFYTVLLIIEMYLMIKFTKKGPSILGSGKYHFEQKKENK